MTDSNRLTASERANLVVAVIIMLMVAAMTWWFLTEASDETRVPLCTHEIANDGGICRGEPY